MHDVIIVGGGVAGCYTASLLPRQLDILVLEKDKKARIKDSGVVSRHFREFFRDPRLIKTEEKEIEFISPSGRSFLLKSEEPFIYILKRRKFTRYLRKMVGQKAKIRYESVIEVINNKDFITVRTNRGEYNTKMLVGCDGANSLVRKSLRIKPPVLSLGIMVKTKEPFSGRMRVFLNKYYSPDYFSWIIPQNKEYGIITAIRPREYLTFFARRQNLPRGKMYAHMIPMGLTKSYGDRTILIGDACGQNKPLTGGGIVFSLTASRIASRIIKDAFEVGNFSQAFLSYYEKMWKAVLGKEIKRQMIVRKIYRNLTNAEIDGLFESFGPSIQNMGSFDYDRLSLSWSRLPRWKLLRFAFSKARYIF